MVLRGSFRTLFPIDVSMERLYLQCALDIYRHFLWLDRVLLPEQSLGNSHCVLVRTVQERRYSNDLKVI
jgi:hypothetical protein